MSPREKEQFAKWMTIGGLSISLLGAVGGYGLRAGIDAHRLSSTEIGLRKITANSEANTSRIQRLEVRGEGTEKDLGYIKETVHDIKSKMDRLAK